MLRSLFRNGIYAGLLVFLLLFANPIYAVQKAEPVSIGRPQPLPKVIGRPTPFACTDPVACLYGVVWMNGLAISGAEVEIRTANGGAKIVKTRVEPDARSSLPIYVVNLSLDLGVQPEDTITVIARWAGREQQIDGFVVARGSQELDIEINRGKLLDYALDARIGIVPGEGADSFAIDANSNIYVARGAPEYRVDKYRSDGKFLRSWDGIRHSGSNASEILTPEVKIHVYHDRVFILNRSEGKVYVFDLDGDLQTSWGGIGVANGSFNQACDLASDRSGRIYVTDSLSHRVQRFSQSGEFEVTWGGFGSGSGQFIQPCAIGISTDDKVYVSDTNRLRVQTFNLDGKFDRLWINSNYSSALNIEPHGTNHLAISSSRLFARVSLVIDRIREVECVDEAGPICISSPDFYALASVGEVPFGKQSDRYLDESDISPGWTYSIEVDLSQVNAVPMQLQIWDVDGGSGGDDDFVDVNPTGGKRHLDFSVNLANCQIVGDVPSGSRCGPLIYRRGSGEDRKSVV